MIPTLEYIERKFNEFNAQMFEGKLNPLPFKTTRARTFLGQVRYFREKNPDNTWHYCNFDFVISTTIDLPEQEVEDTIIHEMIHYYILSNQMQDTSPHGELFIRKMQEINVKYDRNITVSHKATNEEQDSDTEVREHLICVTHFTTGKFGITIVNKSSLFRLWEELAKFPKVDKCDWYISKDPFYNRYPRASSAKVYSITRAELEEHNKDFQQLVRTGNNIRVVKK